MIIFDYIFVSQIFMDIWLINLLIQDQCFLIMFNSTATIKPNPTSHLCEAFSLFSFFLFFFQVLLSFWESFIC